MSNELKLYTVTASIDYVVVAESEEEAYNVAYQNAVEAFRDTPREYLELAVNKGVHAHGWDDECIPYGGDGSTRTSEYR